MGKVRLRDPQQARNGPEVDPAIGIRPLSVVGVVVRRAEIIEALRVYVPTLADVRVTEDGEHFWLMLGDSKDKGADRA